jgi:hypothetical protein
MSRILESCSQFTTEVANEVLGDQLGQIHSVELQSMGEGVGLMSSIARAILDTAQGEKRIVVKCIAQTDNSEISKALNFYSNEVNFYRELAGKCPVESPPLLYAEIDPDTQDFLLILEDLGSEHAGNQLEDCSREVMWEAFTRIGQLHGRFWDKTADMTFLRSQINDETTLFRRDDIYKPGVEPTIALFGDLVSDEMASAIRAIGDQFFELFNRAMEGPQTVVHGDYRTDNMMIFPGPRIVAVDWQNTMRGNGPHDIAYFSSQSCGSDLRGETEMAALRHYYQVLLDEGVTNYSFDQCLLDYQLNLLITMITPVAICGTLDPGNERGVELGRVILKRSLEALDSMGCLRLL